MKLKMSKIVDLIKNKQLTYSFEVTPDVSIEEINDLTAEPTFFSITWHAKTHKCQDLEIAPLQLAEYLRSKGKHVLLHLTCDLLKKEYLNSLLSKLQEIGVCNLFVVLGESYDPSTSDFKQSKELIEYIRQRTGNYFCIGVAGFPGKSEKRLLILKDKIEIGAEFIITQAFFEFDHYKTYVNQCENIGIRVPILPGIFLFETQNQLSAFANLCKVKVSDHLLQNVIGSESPGIEIIKKLIKDISNFKSSSNNFHFFTLNKLQRVSSFVNQLK